MRLFTFWYNPSLLVYTGRCQLNSGDPFPSQWDPHGGPRKTKGLWALEYHILRIDHLSNTYFGFKGAVGLKVSHFHIFWSDQLAHTVCTLRREDWCGGENLLMGEMPPIYIITSDISNLVLVIIWVRHKAKSIGEIMIRNIVTWKTS